MHVARRRARLIAVAVTAALAAGITVAIVSGGGGDQRAVETPRGAGPTGACAAPVGGGGTTPPPGSPAAPPAQLTVPGAAAVDTKGLAPDAVVEDAGGAAWVVVRDPRAPQPPAGVLAHIDAGALAITELTPVVDGCTATAVAAGPGAIWAATCDASAPGNAASGAELVRIDPGNGRVAARVTLPGACAADLAAGDTVAWATSAGRTDVAQRLWRVDAVTGHVDEQPSLAAGETVDGLATTGDDLWTARRSTAGSRLVLTDGHTGRDLVSLAAPPSQVVGVVGGSLWTQDRTSGALVARDLRTGAATKTVTLPNVRAVAAGASGVWFEQAAPGSLTITIGRVDVAAGTATPVVSFTGTGPDRTGLPFLGTLSATRRGAWFASQDRLFLVAP